MGRKKVKGSTENKENEAPAKSGAPRCTWSTEDRDILLRVLKKEKDGGNQSESGWKKTVWSTCASAFAAETSNDPPKTGAKCNDQFGKLKEAYNEVNYLVNLSGFGWDGARNVVSAPEDVWAPILANRPTLKKWKDGKVWPHYSDMSYLVDGIVATGAGAFNAGLSPPGTPRSPSPPPSPTQDPNSSQDTQSSPPPPSPLPAVATAVELRVSSRSLVGRKRTRAPSDSPSPTPANKKGSARKRVRGPDAIEGMTKALFHIGDAMKSTEVDYHKQAIEMIEDDGDLSDRELVQAFTLFDSKGQVAQTYCSIKRKNLRTLYIQQLLSSTPDD
ncbi:hypothetical protein BKA70DRAFT_1266082 [Coprinopsis sp. MPI-PUGE-AT-0042]|nr:hypothetical protein BKA70DRAFT_1266082 [Coprinopsis sp. MPI-PUGE-AT-0042]